MDATLELTHERVDDVPLLLGFLIQLRLPEILDRHLPPHPLHQGLSNGWLITVWIAYILSQADHRKSHVQAWVDGLHHTLETLIGQPIRPVEFSDDRLTLVLNRLSDPDAWHELEADLWHTQCDVYALPPVERVHLDATTSYGYHAIDDDGLMQLGHSKDHRPDLPQIKLMAAAAEPERLVPGRRRPSRQCRRRPVVPPVVSPGPRPAGPDRAALRRRLQDGGPGDPGRDRRQRGFLPDPAPLDRRGRGPVRRPGWRRP